MIVNGTKFKQGVATAKKLAWKGVRRNNYVEAERFASVKRVRIAEDAGSVAITCSDMQATAVVALEYCMLIGAYNECTPKWWGMRNQFAAIAAMTYDAIENTIRMLVAEKLRQENNV